MQMYSGRFWVDFVVIVNVELLFNGMNRYDTPDHRKYVKSVQY